MISWAPRAFSDGFGPGEAAHRLYNRTTIETKVGVIIAGACPKYNLLYTLYRNGPFHQQ